MYSALAIFAAAGNPAFRQVYDATLDTFPAAEILLAGSIYFISAILNFVIYHQRWRIAEKKEKTMSEHTVHNRASKMKGVSIK